jgi:hypothetical protein
MGQVEEGENESDSWKAMGYMGKGGRERERVQVGIAYF